MKRLTPEVQTMLEQKIIPFWLSLKDERYGGFISYVDLDLRRYAKAEKGCILNSRILWFFSEAAMLLHTPELSHAADHAYRFLMRYCVDRKAGGVFWSVTYDGKLLDTTKHTYNQAFAIYALSAYYRLTGNPEALQTARQLFQIVEMHCRDAEGYGESYDRFWNPQSNAKLSENGVMAERTMNTLLHVFEGYSGLYQAAKSPEVEKELRALLDIWSEKMFDPEKRRQEVFFDRSYHSLIDLQSYGHDIESAWLLDWGCDLLGDRELSEKIHRMTDVLAESVLERGFDGEAVCNEIENGVTDTDRIWWVQSEAILGFTHMLEKHPEQAQYGEAAEKVWACILRLLVDPRENSEWFWKVDIHGKPVKKLTIVDPWKCPYHNGRMCMEIIKRNH